MRCVCTQKLLVKGKVTECETIVLKEKETIIIFTSNAFELIFVYIKSKNIVFTCSLKSK